ncbi:MAG TPA: CerR family C-terminal domain-containing protein [Rubrivivax sp.]|nr:CerR family C-terminal domain-containing protein [Rubrivivax sp.]HPO19211.1 CerR family C-terminal domain-containing protein [Rubrivivax sp.]
MNALQPLPSASTAASARTLRQSGEAARERLLRSALLLFARQGYAKTSTRELTEHAGVNVASISYYFGDKAGLYRAALFEPLDTPQHDAPRISQAGQTLAQALSCLLAAFVEPLRQGDTARLCMQLHLREMLEPTGLCEAMAAHSFAPMHEALLQVLCRQFGVAQADDELRRLALCIIGLGIQLHVGRDLIDALAPGLNTEAGALDRWSARLVGYALAMVDAERARRSEASTQPQP